VLGSNRFIENLLKNFKNPQTFGVDRAYRQELGVFFRPTQYV